ncbi:Uncharacterized membrane protein YbhN, UPF0104 family [Modicisalibacter ilicicola DSM 19980]|uniref:Uncharacterized membrane protein YbhN, UPF0104 family n=1 Tax=Modicisalibacter ilicicola DSM 19980 TaxID=1121942 RepID=A0A1M4Y051_9GAMM|nr:Uncharacterized membrane protein YbhN, UPF0104 family [Halomonas ilicicola DSM 19980]
MARLLPPHAWIRLLASAVLLGLLAWWLDMSTIAAELQGLSASWVMLALALTLPQVAVSAWRWRLTARLLGIRLAWGAALGDYYLATFLNQLLPGGVMGDAARAWRHARASGERAAALRAVIIERVSGQLVLAVMTASVLLSPLWHRPLSAALGDGLDRLAATGTLVWLTLAFVLLVAGLALYRLYTRPPRLFETLTRGLGRDLFLTLLSSHAWPRQLLGSLLVVGSYVAVFVCAARAIGTELPLMTLLALIPPVLLAMAIPLSVAGWGLREGAAALVWAAAGLAPAQGVAVSMAYGGLVLVSSLPGALFLMSRRSRRLGRRERQVEQGVVAAGKGAGAGSQCLVEGRDRRQVEPGTPRTNQQRRDQHVQAMQDAGLEKARDSHPAALDQHPLEPPCGQRVEHSARGDAGIIDRQGDALDMATERSRDSRVTADQMQGRCLGGLEDMMGGAESPPGVEHHAHRVSPRDMADAEPGVVGLDRSGPHQHGIDQGAQAVQMNPALEPVHIVRCAGHGGDSTVQALAELGDRQRPSPHHQGHQAVEQVTHVVGDGAVVRPGTTLPKAQARHTGSEGQGR